MTRDEAIDAVYRAHHHEDLNGTCEPWSNPANNKRMAEKAVDGYVALGLLTLDAPEEPIDDLEKHLIAECGWLLASIVVLRKAMHHVGLKAVRA